METPKYMMKKIFFLLLVLLGMRDGVSAQSSHLMPFFRSFLDGDMENVKLFEPNQIEASGRKADNTYKRANQAKPVKNLGLRLTQGKEEVGAFYLPDYIFSTKDGLLIEFEYIMMYTNPSEKGLTDGICMFLVDATTNQYIGDNLKYGAEGAGFGYTHRSSVHQSISKGVLPITGMKGGYLAVALDQDNFKNWRMEDYEMRNGIPYNDNLTTIANAQLLKYNTRSNVTIRGAAGRGKKTITTKQNTHEIPEGSWGFPVLITRHTGWSITGGLEDEHSNGLRNEAGFELNTMSGQYERHVTPRIDKPFNISGGGVFSHSDESTYRKAIIALEPNDNGGGFKITVTIQHGTDKTVVIENYTYPSSLSYTENSLPIRIAGGSPPKPIWYTTPPVTDLTLITPQRLCIGFMASTGQLTAHTNIIKNLRITPLYGARAEDDIYEHRRGPATVRPLDNDVAYRGEGSTPNPGKDNLDPRSFRIWKNDKECLGSEVFVYEAPNEGKWVYNPELAEMMFFPVKGFKGEVSIMYDVKGKYAPYDDELFRSSLAKIVINIDDNQP